MLKTVTTVSPLTLTSCPSCPDYPDCGGLDAACPAWRTFHGSAPLTRELARVDMRAVGVTA